jgi:hypothetical protein
MLLVTRASNCRAVKWLDGAVHRPAGRRDYENGDCLLSPCVSSDLIAKAARLFHHFTIIT